MIAEGHIQGVYVFLRGRLYQESGQDRNRSLACLSTFTGRQVWLWGPEHGGGGRIDPREEPTISGMVTSIQVKGEDIFLLFEDTILIQWEPYQLLVSLPTGTKTEEADYFIHGLLNEALYISLSRR